MTMRKLNLKDLDSQDVNNLSIISSYINENPFMNFIGSFLNVSFTSAVTNYKIKHGLKAIPLDIILTYQSDPPVTIPPTPPVTVTFNKAKFDNTYIDITTSGAVDLRFFVGIF